MKLGISSEILQAFIPLNAYKTLVFICKPGVPNFLSQPQSLPNWGSGHVAMAVGHCSQ
jgi:hypothetical protein